MHRIVVMFIFCSCFFASTSWAEPSVTAQEAADYLNTQLPITASDPQYGSFSIVRASVDGHGRIVVHHRLSNRRGALSSREKERWRQQAIKTHCAKNEMSAAFRTLNLVWVQNWVNSINEPLGSFEYSNKDCR